MINKKIINRPSTIVFTTSLFWEGHVTGIPWGIFSPTDGRYTLIPRGMHHSENSLMYTEVSRSTLPGNAEQKVYDCSLEN